LQLLVLAQAYQQQWTQRVLLLWQQLGVESWQLPVNAEQQQLKQHTCGQAQLQRERQLVVDCLGQQAVSRQ
jgi:hypothetical protein